jgi:hypothetical protein
LFKPWPTDLTSSDLSKVSFAPEKKKKVCEDTIDWNRTTHDVSAKDQKKALDESLQWIRKHNAKTSDVNEPYLQKLASLTGVQIRQHVSKVQGKGCEKKRTQTKGRKLPNG